MQLSGKGEVVGVDREGGDVQLDLAPHSHTCSWRVVLDTRTIRFPAPIVWAAVWGEQSHAINLTVVLLLSLGQTEELLWPIAGHLVAKDGDVSPPKQDRVLAITHTCTLFLDLLAGGEPTKLFRALSLLCGFHRGGHILLAMSFAHLPTVLVQTEDAARLLPLPTAPKDGQ